VTTKAKAAKAINLIISFLPYFASYLLRLVTAFRVKQHIVGGLEASTLRQIKKFQKAFAKRFSALNLLHNARSALGLAPHLPPSSVDKSAEIW
jgi:hypothetical protein